MAGSDMEINFSSYLTWSGEDERRPLVCTDVGSASVPPRSAYPPAPVSHPDEYVSVATGRTVNEYQLVYVTRGRGTLRTNGKTWDIVPGTAILVFPRVRHAYGPDAEQGWDERWVGFKGSYIEALRADGTISSERPVFSVGLDERLLVHFEELFGAVRAAEPFFQMRAGARIMLLLAELLSRERKTAQADGTAALVEKAKFLIAEKAGGSLSVDGVAGELGVGQARLHESFPPLQEEDRRLPFGLGGTRQTAARFLSRRALSERRIISGITMATSSSPPVTRFITRPGTLTRPMPNLR